MALRLAKSGYFGGDPDAVMGAPVDTVMNILHFESFESDYEIAYDRLNRRAAP